MITISATENKERHPSIWSLRGNSIPSADQVLLLWYDQPERALLQTWETHPRGEGTIYFQVNRQVCSRLEKSTKEDRFMYRLSVFQIYIHNKFQGIAEKNQHQVASQRHCQLPEREVLVFWKSLVCWSPLRYRHHHQPSRGQLGRALSRELLHGVGYLGHAVCLRGGNICQEKCGGASLWGLRRHRDADRVSFWAWTGTRQIWMVLWGTFRLINKLIIHWTIN